MATIFLHGLRLWWKNFLAWFLLEYIFFLCVFYRFYPFSKIQALLTYSCYSPISFVFHRSADITRFVAVPYVIDEHDRYIRRLWLLIVSSMVVTECRRRPISVSLPWIESIYQVQPSWLVLKGGLLLGLEQDTLIE